MSGITAIGIVLLFAVSYWIAYAIGRADQRAEDNLERDIEIQIINNYE